MVPVPGAAPAVADSLGLSRTHLIRLLAELDEKRPHDLEPHPRRARPRAAAAFSGYKPAERGAKRILL